MDKKLPDNGAAEWDDKVYDVKTAIMEDILGVEFNQVMHATIPYNIGGSLDLYYYPNFRGGTAIATKELADFEADDAKNDLFDSYEFVMCTRKKIDMEGLEQKNYKEGTFARMHGTIRSVLNGMARYSKMAKLNPYETAEIPSSVKDIGGKCFILHNLNKPIKSADTKNKSFGLMLIIEVFRSEMEFAMQQKGGGKELIQKLIDKSVYPFSDMDREPVV